MIASTPFIIRRSECSDALRVRQRNTAHGAAIDATGVHRVAPRWSWSVRRLAANQHGPASDPSLSSRLTEVDRGTHGGEVEPVAGTDIARQDPPRCSAAQTTASAILVVAAEHRDGRCRRAPAATARRARRRPGPAGLSLGKCASMPSPMNCSTSPPKACTVPAHDQPRVESGDHHRGLRLPRT